jgi:LEA14-like dessication related protein
MNKIRRLAICLLVILVGGVSLFALSAKLEKPKITYVKYEVKKVTFKDTKVDFIYSIDNPNPVGLKHISVDYALYLGYKEKPANTPPTGTGRNVTFDVKAKGVSPFVLPLTINYEGFYKSAARLTKVILGGQKTIPFVLDTTFTLNLKILKFKIPVEAKGELPLPDVKNNIMK